MKTEDAVGYIDRMISEQEDYKVYALGHRSDDEELLGETFLCNFSTQKFRTSA